MADSFLSMYDKNHYNIVISLQLIKINGGKKISFLLCQDVSSGLMLIKCCLHVLPQIAVIAMLLLAFTALYVITLKCSMRLCL